MTEDRLYADLPAFEHFVDHAFESRYYRAVPGHWLIQLADIESSTDAVAAGRYHDVNYIGAACVAAFNQLLNGLPVATVFGGDGATAVVPGGAAQSARQTLLGLRQWARREFDLELRVGSVPVAEIERQGASLAVGKMRLSPGNEVAMFRGRGLDIADALIKRDRGQRYRLADSPAAQPRPSLDELSCRWSPMPPQRDAMLCLIIGSSADDRHSQQQRDRCYADIVQQINAIVALDDPRSSPVKLSALDFQLRWRAMRSEINSRSGALLTRVARVLMIHVFARLLFATAWRAGNFDPDIYRKEIPVNSDFMKVSGMIRLVLDCTAEQISQIEQLLESAHQRGDIVYGLQRAERAIMTCLTPDVSGGRHLHYIDGSNGGFWAAAGDLKQRQTRADERASNNRDADRQRR